MDKSREKRILYVILILIGLIIALKLSVFYMPFLIAFIISLIIEPAIRFIMKKLKLTRKTSSIIIFIVVATVILGGLAWGIVALFSEASKPITKSKFFMLIKCIVYFKVLQIDLTLIKFTFQMK